MKILLFDCHDSFTYNLAQAINRLKSRDDSLDVVTCDRLRIDSVADYDKIILSPGPGLPSEAGSLMRLIGLFAPLKSMLGVCLGHQALAQAFGAKLLNLQQVFHGVKSQIRLLEKNYLFEGLPDQIPGGRYHSWLVDDRNLPGSLKVTARDEGGQIMAISHTRYDVHGLQFHPESILTPDGPRIIANFMRGGSST
jgi:anthranilate synthase component 2